MSDLLDPSVFEELKAAVGEDFAAELLETFLSDAENMFADLDAAVAQGDADGYRRACHSLKSNAQTFGAVALADEAREMELAGAIDAKAATHLRATFDTSASALRGLQDG